MQSTILKVLRDTKLTDGTLIRLSLLEGETWFELSVIFAGDRLAKIILPNTTEAVFELLQMSTKLLQSSMQKDMGKVVLENT